MEAESVSEVREWAEQVRKECCLAFWYLEYLIELGNRPLLFKSMHAEVSLIACQSHLIAIEDGLLMLISRLMEGGGGSKRRSAIKLVRKLGENSNGLEECTRLNARRLRERFDALDVTPVRDAVLFYRDEELAHLLAPFGSDNRGKKAPAENVNRRARVDFACSVLELSVEAIRLVFDFDAEIERRKAKSKVSAYFNMIERAAQ